MLSIPTKRFTVAALCLIALMTSGCRLNVDKDANGKEKKVQIDTPFGGMHVKTDETKASDLGLPEYPGATIEADKDGSNSADVNMGFGDWRLRVKAVKYATTDSREKVLAFYKNSLSKYGDVITCQDGRTLGKPVRTREGLTCDAKQNTHVKLGHRGVTVGESTDQGLDLDKGLELKTGSQSHQRIVGFEEDASGGKTRFALVLLDLPTGKNSDNAN